MVFRKFGIVLSLVGTSFLAFMTVSHATGSTRPTFPAFDQPSVSLPPATERVANALLSEETKSQFGISPDAFLKARLISETPAGPFYLIPGTAGACLVTPAGPGAASCSDLTSGNTFALWVSEPSGDVMVGAGITPTGAPNVILVLDGARTTSISTTQGSFSITPELGIKRTTVVEFVQD